MNSELLVETSIIMVWLPFGKSSGESTLSSVQIEQRSHTPLNVAPKDSDIAHTLNQIASDDSQPRVKVLTGESRKQTNELVTTFVEQRPKNMFIIDGEKYANESIICTNDERGNKTCLKLMYNLIELFKHMQHLEYFCLLPNDIDATYFECRKIT